MDIIYEDNHLFIPNKPAGLLTQPTDTQPDSLEERAKTWIKKKEQKPGNVYLHAVHRLDKPVSGIVVFARTSKALSRLNTTMREKKSTKQYLAWIEGTPDQEEGTLEHTLLHDSHRARVDPQGKNAKLSYRIVKKTSSLSLVAITLDTGRYHQIRVQFATIGCPIVGDTKYGSQKPFEKGCIALHHNQLIIEHPTKKEMLTLEAPLPKNWAL